MARVKIAVDESLIYFESPTDRWAYEIEVDDNTLRGWRQAMAHADRVQEEMREAYHAAVQPAEIPAVENKKPHWSEFMENPGYIRP